MHKFSEDLLQFIWKNRLLTPGPYFSKSGKAVTIIKPGELNTDSGPDFFNSQLNIDGLLLIGNVEVHIHTSDWLKHNHQFDKSYDTIILHVVYEHDTDLAQNRDYNVEVLEIKNLITEETFRIYQDLVSTPAKLPCSAQLPTVSAESFSAWMEKMTVERLGLKMAGVERLFKSTNGDYLQTFYTLLLRNFGFKVNAVPFELLAKNLPLQILLKHADNLMQLEALLLGTAGMLNDQFETRYILNLQNEYEYLKQKYGLIPLRKEIFKFSRLRPANFPNLRLAQLATLIYSNRFLFSIAEVFTNYGDLMAALKLSAQGYWKNHYTLDGNLSEKDLHFGKSSAENIIINTFAPFFYFYGNKLNKTNYSSSALALLKACKSEDNVKTRLFLGQKPQLSSAAHSQALIHLYDNYCVAKKCLQCGVGAEILNRSVTGLTVETTVAEPDHLL